MLKITANNALILFVDSRNQSFFNAPPSRLPLRLINLSPKVSEVLSDASKSSLRRIIDFKKRKRSSGKQSLLPAYQGGFSQTSDVTPFSPQELSKVGLLSDWNIVQIASLEKSLSAVFDSQQLLLAEVDPQIAEYCMNAQDFSGCVETMQGSTDPAYPASEVAILNILKVSMTMNTLKMNILKVSMTMNTLKMNMLKVRMTMNILKMNILKMSMTMNILKMNMLKVSMAMMNLMTGVECIPKIWVLQRLRLAPVILLENSWRAH